MFPNCFNLYSKIKIITGSSLLSSKTSGHTFRSGLKFYKGFVVREAYASSPNKIFKMLTAAFVTDEPGPKIAATPAW